LRLAALIGADRGSTLFASAHHELIALGVANPERLSQIYMTGFNRILDQQCCG
jgi:hypothetical protein